MAHNSPELNSIDYTIQSHTAALVWVANLQVDKTKNQPATGWLWQRGNTSFKWKYTIFIVLCVSGSAEALVRECRKINSLIAYYISNISANKYQNK